MIQPNSDQDSAASDPTGTTQFPASTRVYIEGSRPDIQVPMREVSLSPTQRPNGAGEEA